MSDEEIIVPYIPHEIITFFKEEYPYIQELLEYKRDATLALLKGYGAIALYEGSIGLNVKSDVKNWEDFIEFSRDYTRKLVQDGLQKYQYEEKNEKNEDNKKKKFQILDMGLLGPAIEMISNRINDDYLRKFPKWPTSGTQEGYINVFIKNSTETNDLRFYWVCRGTIFVKDTKYSSPRNECPYRAEFSGKPEFHIAYFDLDKIRQCNDLAKTNMSLIKSKIDKIEEKYLEQNLSKLLAIDIDL